MNTEDFLDDDTMVRIEIRVMRDGSVMSRHSTNPTVNRDALGILILGALDTVKSTVKIDETNNSSPKYPYV